MNVQKFLNKYFFVIAGLLVCFDQATKLAVKGFTIFGFTHQGMQLGESIRVIGKFIEFAYVENEGMAFGISFGAGKIFLSLFSIAASIAVALYLSKLRKKDSFFVKLAFSLILAGAMGNLIDRVFYGVIFGESSLFYGRVVDFISVDIPDINLFGSLYTRFPVFNVADSCVSCGVVLLIIFNKHIPPIKELFKKTKIPEENEIIN